MDRLEVDVDRKKTRVCTGFCVRCSTDARGRGERGRQEKARKGGVRSRSAQRGRCEIWVMCAIK
jgi:hypothetical protein